MQLRFLGLLWVACAYAPLGKSRLGGSLSAKKPLAKKKGGGGFGANFAKGDWGEYEATRQWIEGNDAMNLHMTIRPRRVRLWCLGWGRGRFDGASGFNRGAGVQER